MIFKVLSNQFLGISSHSLYLILFEPSSVIWCFYVNFGYQTTHLLFRSPSVILLFPLPSSLLRVLLPPVLPGGSDVCWVQEDVMATAIDSGDVVLWKHGSLGHSLQRLSTLGCHDSMVLGLDGWERSTLLIHGGDGVVTLINVAEEKVVSLYTGLFYAGSTHCQSV